MEDARISAVFHYTRPLRQRFYASIRCGILQEPISLSKNSERNSSDETAQPFSLS